ncbi:6-carboxytetrahydropterin synthase [Chryseobacterium sp. JJR-5R]|uniref:6-pyruvoyl trahydropterin synthase family protein n=1 Tax=Chryseobacterium sp. JJR-5R TaxID=3093923 RepID=UPI002A74F570|nr:6-carboxytetrahydropterin synthase [Chryseobacterium sp. JJR-5R]WPO84508.1 6-carboxytetrahydropterin synthase [Chryseobacterium sp. JJR-5R]
MKVKVSRRATFNAAHRLHNNSWTETKNKEIFGKCNNPYFHGHNYTLFTSVIGEVCKETGFVIDLGYLSSLINELIIDYLDHKNLNLEIIEFEDLNPTLENMLIVIYNRLRNKIDKKYYLEVKLFETENNFAEISDSA